MSELIPKDWFSGETNDFKPQYEDKRLNDGDIDAELFQRTPDDNDRPMLEKFYNMLNNDDDGVIETIRFYGFVIPPKDEKSKKTAIVHIINEFGEHMASHIITKVSIIQKFVNELISFDGRIYKYPDKDKYGIKILKNSIQVVSTKPLKNYKAYWNKLTNYIPSSYLKINDVINHEYIIKDKDFHISMLYKSEKILDRYSEEMFGISGLIYPMISNLFVMRDDVSDKNDVYRYHKHLNILSTLVIDYIANIKPKSYKETLCIISYLVLNYIGLFVDNPRSKEYNKYFSITLKYMGIKPEHAVYHVTNIIKNVEGLQNIQNSIPKEYKLTPLTIANTAKLQFARRLLIIIPEKRHKFYIDKKFYKDSEI